MRIPSLLIATTLGLLVGVVASGCGSDDSDSSGTAGTGGVAGSGGGVGGTGGGETGGTGGGATGGSGGGATGGSGGGATGGSAGAAGEAGAAGSAGAGGGACTAVDASNFMVSYVDATSPYSEFIGETSPNLDGAAADLLWLEFTTDATGQIALDSAGVNDNYETCEQCAMLYTDDDGFDFTRQFFQSAGTIDIDATVGPMSGGLKATITDLTLIEVTVDADFLSTPVANGECIIVNGPLQIDLTPPPAEWTCEAGYYNDGADCDCGCGVWDPDCDISAADPFGCQAGQTCVAPSECDGIPTAWTCTDAEFEDGTNCNCECGAFDPDCENDTLPIVGCATGDTCGTGVCIPEAWTCGTSSFGKADGCDCDCGAWDPDCDDDAQSVYGCGLAETLQQCIDDGKCTAP